MICEQFINISFFSYLFQRLNEIKINSIRLSKDMNDEDTKNGLKVDGDLKPLKFSTSFMDTSIKPCTDFYRYCNNSWLSQNPIPDDKSSFGTFSQMSERNKYLLGKILEDCASGSIKDSNGIKLGDFYTSAMNISKIEELKFAPIVKIMTSIEGISSRKELLEKYIELHGLGIQCFFTAESSPDKKNSSIYAFYLEQGGLTLPDRDYYLSETFSTLKKDYQKHVANMFVIYGYDIKKSEKIAENILSIETDIAKIHRTRADLRDEEKNYNRVETEKVSKSYKSIQLLEYMDKLKIPTPEYVIVGQPEAIQYVSDLLETHDVEELKSYLLWNVLRFVSPFLHSEVENENFDFFGKKLMGKVKKEDRWKNAVRIIDGCMGEAMGEIFVHRHFGNDARERANIMVADIIETFKDRLSSLPWMGEETRNKALLKFSRFRAKIGHPDKFRNYDSLVIRSDDYAGNIFRAIQFEVNRQMSRVGSNVDRNEWYMSPPTVNAYFSPTDNEIVFPAGILQPPGFDPEMDDAINYGSMGAVIGHEITHGFDDQGRLYDENGNMVNWWSDKDKEMFTSLANEIDVLYNGLEPLPGINVNGKLTLGENIADIGGLSIAFEALQRKLNRDGRPDLIDGFTPEQRFFISFSQLWKNNMRNEFVKLLITSDPHSPDMFRGSIPAYMHEGFSSAFNCSYIPEEGTKFKRINIW